MKLYFQVQSLWQPTFAPAFGNFSIGELRQFVVPTNPKETFEQVAVRAQERYNQNYLEGRKGGWQVKKLTTNDGYDIDLGDTVGDVFDDSSLHQQNIVRMHLALDNQELSLPGDSGLRLGGVKRKRDDLYAHSSKKARKDTDEVESSPPAPACERQVRITDSEPHRDAEGFKVPAKPRSGPAAEVRDFQKVSLHRPTESPDHTNQSHVQEQEVTAADPITPTHAKAIIPDHTRAGSSAPPTKSESRVLTDGHKKFKLPPRALAVDASHADQANDKRHQRGAQESDAVPAAQLTAPIERTPASVAAGHDRLTEANLVRVAPARDIVSPFISALQSRNVNTYDPDELTEPGTQPQRPAQSVSLHSSGSPWSVREDQIILDAIRSKRNPNQIQQSLIGRSLKAIDHRVKALARKTREEQTNPTTQRAPSVQIRHESGWNKIDLGNIRLGLKHNQSPSEIFTKYFSHKNRQDVFNKVSEIKHIVRKEEEATTRSEQRQSRVRQEDASGQTSTTTDERYTQEEEDLLLAARFAHADMVRIADKYFPRRPSEHVVSRAKSLFHKMRGKAQTRNPDANLTDSLVSASIDPAAWVRIQSLFPRLEADKAEFNRQRSEEIDGRERNIAREEQQRHKRQVDRALREQRQSALRTQEGRNREVKLAAERRVRENAAMQAKHKEQLQIWEKHCQQARHRGEPLPPRPPAPTPSTYGLYRELQLSSPIGQHSMPNQQCDTRNPPATEERRLRSGEWTSWDPETRQFMGLDGIDDMDGVDETAQQPQESEGPSTPVTPERRVRRSDRVVAGPPSTTKPKPMRDGKLTTLLDSNSKSLTTADGGADNRHDSAALGVTDAQSSPIDPPQSSKKRGKRPARHSNHATPKEAIVEIEPVDPVRLSQFVQMEVPTRAEDGGKVADGDAFDGNSSTAVVPASSAPPKTNANQRQTTLPFARIHQQAKAGVVQPKHFTQSHQPVPTARKSKQKSKKTIGVTLQGSPYHSSIPDQAFAEIAEKVEKESLHHPSSQPNIDTSPIREGNSRHSRKVSLDSAAEQLQREMKIASSAKPVSSEPPADDEMHDVRQDTGGAEYALPSFLPPTQPSQGILAAAVTRPQYRGSEDVDVIYGDMPSDRDSIPPSPPRRSQEGDKPQWWYEEQAAREKHDAEARRRWAAMSQSAPITDRQIEEVEDEEGDALEAEEEQGTQRPIQLQGLVHSEPVLATTSRRASPELPMSATQGQTMAQREHLLRAGGWQQLPGDRQSGGKVRQAGTLFPGRTQEISSDESARDSSEEPSSSSLNSSPSREREGGNTTPESRPTHTSKTSIRNKESSDVSSSSDDGGNPPFTAKRLTARKQAQQALPLSTLSTQNRTLSSSLGPLRPPFPSSGLVPPPCHTDDLAAVAVNFVTMPNLEQQHAEAFGACEVRSDESHNKDSNLLSHVPTDEQAAQTSRAPPARSDIASSKPSQHSTLIDSRLLPPLSQTLPTLIQMEGASDPPQPHSSPMPTTSKRQKKPKAKNPAKHSARLRNEYQRAGELERMRIDAMLASRAIEGRIRERKAYEAKRKFEAHVERKAKRLRGDKISPHTSDSEIMMESDGSESSSDAGWVERQAREKERRRAEALQMCRGRQVRRNAERTDEDKREEGCEDIGRQDAEDGGDDVRQIVQREMRGEMAEGEVSMEVQVSREHRSDRHREVVVERSKANGVQLRQSHTMTERRQSKESASMKETRRMERT
ncbi:Hypothetical protein D9617_10g073750 [Elsinoe fawcettii]|nr:Hypothetical protein D9617_10g073750 [Elsinoe fawcettii]